MRVALLEVAPTVSEVECAARPAVDPIDHPLTIAEVAERTGIGVHALRYYERVGLLDVPRDDAGRRQYGQVEVGRVVFISYLRATGMPIRDLQAYFALVADGPGNERARLAIMQRHRDDVVSQLAAAQTALTLIEAKIAMYGARVGA